MRSLLLEQPLRPQHPVESVRLRVGRRRIGIRLETLRRRWRISRLAETRLKALLETIRIPGLVTSRFLDGNRG
jgi:hypothetical protein